MGSHGHDLSVLQRRKTAEHDNVLETLALSLGQSIVPLECFCPYKLDRMQIIMSCSFGTWERRNTSYSMSKMNGTRRLSHLEKKECCK